MGTIGRFRKTNQEHKHVHGLLTQPIILNP